MKVLKIEFGENEKAQNKKLSRHDGFQASEDEKSDFSSAYVCSDLFESERELFYGPDWVRLLFPYLNY